MYFDGHEREDVVKYRTEFLEKLEEFDRKCIYEGHTSHLFEGETPLIHVHHDDELTFFQTPIKSAIGLTAQLLFSSRRA